MTAAEVVVLVAAASVDKQRAEVEGPETDWGCTVECQVKMKDASCIVAVRFRSLMCDDTEAVADVQNYRSDEETGHSLDEGYGVVEAEKWVVEKEASALIASKQGASDRWEVQVVRIDRETVARCTLVVVEPSRTGLVHTVGVEVMDSLERTLPYEAP